MGLEGRDWKAGLESVIESGTVGRKWRAEHDMMDGGWKVECGAKGLAFAALRRFTATAAMRSESGSEDRTAACTEES